MKSPKSARNQHRFYTKKKTATVKSKKKIKHKQNQQNRRAEIITIIIIAVIAIFGLVRAYKVANKFNNHEHYQEELLPNSNKNN